MRVAAVILAVIAMAGCWHSQKEKDAPTPKASLTTEQPPEDAAPPEPEWAGELRAEATAHQMNYTVYCWGDYFYGVAWPYGGKRGKYIEEGSLGEWVVQNYTQRGAATDLTLAIRMGKRSGDYMPPEHRPKERDETIHGKMCPPELRGGEGVDRP